MILFLVPELSVYFILFCLFCFTILILLWYYLYYFARISFYTEPDLASSPLDNQRLRAQLTEDGVPVSIVICCKNEDHNLPEFLPHILSQDYPNYEVVVVDDCSSDNTPDVLRMFEKKYKRLKVITVKEDKKHHHGKKFAVMVGIKGAANEYLLFTDGDCKPLGNQWLRKMMRNFSNPLLPSPDKPREQEETEIVLGYSKYEKLPGFLNKLIRFDTFHIALQYLSFAMAGSPYMGVGRNLAYKKSLFFKHKGFATHYHIESGDDDLFINQAASPANTKAEISPESFTVSRVKKNWKGWIEQKRRHLSTWTEYKTSDKILLGVYPFAQAFFWILFTTLLLLCIFHRFPQPDSYIILFLFAFRIIVQLVIFKRAMDKLKEKDLLLLSLVSELFLLGVYPVLTISNKLFRRQKWKRI
ncbi:MAG: glycosyltransferase [Bacteroidetes bacterium]|nr:MAG: glycosyltransferase [Bacteroidota bacterium]